MKRKKILSIVMALILSLCSFPLTEVQAEEAFPEGETLEKNRTEELEKSVQEITPQTGNVRTANNIWEEYRYRELEDGTLEITGYQGNDTELVIPAEIGGKCVTSIVDRAFYGCSSLTSIELPAGLTSIEERAFSGCSSLTSIELPAGLTSIGSDAFSGCSSLTSIELPAGLTIFDQYAFRRCSSLTEIMVDSNNPVYMSQDGILYDKNKKELICCPGGKSGNIVIPASVTSIGEYAFLYCSSLTGIELPAGLTSIGDSAFSGCDDLVLLVYKSSYAEKYSKKYSLNYRYINDCSHAWDTDIVKATTKKNGSITKTCTECAKQTTETIYAVKNIKLSQTSYTYNGKSQKPSVTVKDRKGKALKNKKDYTITYPKNMKNVGSYTVTIKLKGNYKGTVKKTFQIIPKGSTISKITPKKKGFALKWNKQTVQTTGYEVAYSTNKDFTKKATRTITVGKSKTVSKSVSKLKAKKKYYVKIRTYKAVKINGKAKKLYSAWSKIKTVITK